MTEIFERFVGQQAKVVFKDGDEFRVKHGRLVSVSDGFITLETVHGACAIRLTEVIKIQQTSPPAGEGHGRKHR